MASENLIKYLQIGADGNHHEHSILGIVLGSRPTSLDPNPCPGCVIVDIKPINGLPHITAFVEESSRSLFS